MRIRTIKPAFFKDETLADLPAHARLLFQGLWLLADSDGRLTDRPKRIRAEVFPYEDVDVHGLLQQLADAGFIVRYVVAGEHYLEVPGFRKHQRLSGKEAETKSELPPSPRIGEASVKHLSIAGEAVRHPHVPNEVESVASVSETPATSGLVKQRGSSDRFTNAQEGKGREGKGRVEVAPHPTHHSTEADAIDPESRWVFERREPWARVLDPVVGSKLSKTTWPRWKRLVDRWGAHAVAAAAEALPPEARWDDRVEGHLIEHAPPPPEPEDAELDAVRALIGEHGWQACLAVVGFGNVRSAEVLVIALEGNRPACRKLIAHYGGGAAAGAGAA